MKRASRYIIMLIMAASLFAGCKPTPKVTPTPTAPPSTPQTRTARPGLRTAPEVVVPRTVRPRVRTGTTDTTGGLRARDEIVRDGKIYRENEIVRRRSIKRTPVRRNRMNRDRIRTAIQ